MATRILGLPPPRLPKSWARRIAAFVAAAIVGVLGLRWFTSSPETASPGSATPTPAATRAAAAGESRHWQAPPERRRGGEAVRAPSDIAGHVLDAVTRAPIGGADVTLRASSGDLLAETASDEDGSFLFAQTSGASVAAEARGYAMTAAPVPDGPGVGRIELALDGATTVRGRVVDAAGHALPGAQVWVQDVEGSQRRWPLPSSATVTAGASGAFVVSDAPSGRLVVSASFPAHPDGESEPFVLGPGRSKDGVVVTVPDGARVLGHVYAPDGSPVIGALVGFTAMASDEERGGDEEGSSRADLGMRARVEIAAKSARSGADGSFVLEGLRGRTGIVSAASTDGEGSAQVTLVPGGDATADVNLVAGHSIAGRVEDDAGAPIAGATITAALLDFQKEASTLDWIASATRGQLRELEPTVSGPDGRFRLDGLYAGGTTFRIAAVTPDGDRGEAVAQPGATSATVVVVRGGAIEGELVTPAGAASDRGGAVFVTQPDYNTARDFEGGAFRVGGLAPGTWQVTAAVHGYGRIGPVAATVRAGETAHLRFTLPARGAIHGKLVDRDGRGVPGARVSLAERPGRSMFAGETQGSLDWDAAVRSGPDGSFTLTGEGGEHALFVYHPEYEPALVPITVAESGDTDVGTIPLHAGEGASAVFEFTGIGAVIARDDDGGHYVVRSTLPGSPAEAAGLRPHDRIVAIDGAATDGMEMDDLVGRIRGPVGTTVSLTIVRAGNVEPFQVDITREKLRT